MNIRLFGNGTAVVILLFSEYYWIPVLSGNYEYNGLIAWIAYITFWVFFTHCLWRSQKEIDEKRK